MKPKRRVTSSTTKRNRRAPLRTPPPMGSELEQLVTLFKQRLVSLMTREAPRGRRKHR